MKRQRHVFPTSKIPHLWTNQKQEDARNPQNNLFFEGATIYSYRYSRPLATMFKKGITEIETFILCNSNSYSMVTSTHQRAVNYAINQFSKADVPDSTGHPNHNMNLLHFTNRVEEALSKGQRCLLTHTLNRHYREAISLDEQFRRYIAFFELEKRESIYLTSAWSKAIKRVKSIETPDPIRDGKKFKAKEKRVAQAKIILASNIENWRSGNIQYLSWKGSEKINTIFGVLLRIRGEKIETSMGADIPKDHAPRLWTLIKAVMTSGKPYQHNGHTIPVGNYALDKIETDGTITAGCHIIRFTELERIAKQLNLV